jgi:hypothetical protein
LPDANLDVTASRILWGKAVNAGQTCLAPDYVLCPAKLQDDLVAAFKRALDSFYSKKSPLATSDFSRIVSRTRFDQLASLLEKTKGEIVFGGTRDPETQKIDLTLVRGVDPDDSLMSEEIFGPILPIVAVESKEDAVEFINRRCVNWHKSPLSSISQQELLTLSSRESPLALYVFTSSKNADYSKTFFLSSYVCPDLVLTLFFCSTIEYTFWRVSA